MQETKANNDTVHRTQLIIIHIACQSILQFVAKLTFRHVAPVNYFHIFLFCFHYWFLLEMLEHWYTYTHTRAHARNVGQMGMIAINGMSGGGNESILPQELFCLHFLLKSWNQIWFSRQFQLTFLLNNIRDSNR